MDLSDWPDLDDIEKAVHNEIQLLSNLQSGKVKGTEVVGAFGLSYAYYILSLWRAGGVMVGNQSHHPQMHLLEGNFLGDQTGRVVGWADSHRDVIVPLP